MRKTSFLFLNCFLSLCLATVTFFAACGIALADDPPASPSGPKVRLVNLYRVGDASFADNMTLDRSGDSVELYLALTYDDESAGVYGAGTDWATWVQDQGTEGAGIYVASSSDTSVASVTTEPSALSDGQMKVTALAEGTAAITITYYAADDRETKAHPITSASFTVTVPEQLDEYVTALTIIDEDGNPIGGGMAHEPVVFSEVGEYRQLYVQVSWFDRVSGNSWVEDSRETSGNAIDGVSWTSDDSSVYVNPSTGRLASQPNANSNTALITVNTFKGEGGSEVSDNLYARLDLEGQGGEFVPATGLKIRVEYADMPFDYEPTTYEFSDDELAAALGGLEYQAYTYWKGNGSYSTHLAQGYRLYDIWKPLLSRNVKVSQDDIESFAFTCSRDGYSTHVSYAELYDTIHYFCSSPDLGYEAGDVWLQASVATTPMLCVSAYTALGDDLYSYMNGDTPDYGSVPFVADMRYRLEIGSTRPGDTSAQGRSVYNVDSITIKLKGAPPTGTGDGGNGGDGDSGDTPPDGSGTSQGSGSGGATGNGSGTGNGTDPGTGSGAGHVGSATGTGSNSATPDSGSAGGGSDAAVTATADGNGGSRWQIYEMMNKSKSQIEQIPYDNPLEPYIFPFAAALVVAGGTNMGLGYVRRMGMLRTARA